MRNDFIEHSYKGTTWKKGHLYTKKVGDRYYYNTKTSSKNIANDFVDTPNLQEDAEKLDKIEPIKKIRDVLDTPIWSPNKKEKTVVSEGEELINEILGKDKKEKKLAKR